MRITPAVELEHRCSRLQRAMSEASLDAVMIMQSADLYYFTGTIQAGCLYVPAAGQPVYLVRRDFMRARMESGLKEVVPCSGLSAVAAILADFGYSAQGKIGMELDVVPSNLLERCKKIFTQALFSDASTLIRRIRMIKSHYEIHLMQDAAVQVDKVFRAASGLLREGMTDLQFAAELERIARLEGNPGIMRMRAFNGEICFGHVFSGSDSAVPAFGDTPWGGMGVSPAFGQGAGLKPIQRNEPVLVDFSGSCDGYLVDQTRVFSIGTLPDEILKGYEDMCSIQSLMMQTAPGLPAWGELYDACLAMAENMGYRDNFMGIKGSQVSFIGHGIGVEIDEYPFIAKGFYGDRLAPGMAFAFEPKLVFPGLGAVGIENSFYVADNGDIKQLTFTDENPVILQC